MTRSVRTGATLSLLLIASLLTACGFQLRGQAEVASELVQLSVSGQDINFIRDLRSALSDTGIELTDTAPYTLTLTHLKERTGAISQTGTNQYERLLTLSISYQLKTHDGLEMFAPVTLSNERYALEHKDRVNSAHNWHDTVFAELQQELIMSIIRRITRLSDDALSKEEARVRDFREKELEAAAS